MAEKQSEQVSKAKHDGNPAAQPTPQQTPAQQAATQAAQPPSQQAPQARGQQPSRAMERERRGQQDLTRAPTYVSPFSLMRRMAEEMDSVFEEFGFPRASTLLAPFTGRTPLAQLAETRVWVPEVEVYKRGDELVVRADLPGMDVDDVTITVTDDALILEGERTYEHDEQGENVYRTERGYGRFLRTIPLPEGVNPDTVMAKLENGVLEISMKLPSEEAQRGRKVQISSGAGDISAKPSQQEAKGGQAPQAQAQEKQQAQQKQQAKG